jgi:hypothetical protein
VNGSKRPEKQEAVLLVGPELLGGNDHLERLIDAASLPQVHLDGSGKKFQPFIVPVLVAPLTRCGNPRRHKS